MRDSFQTSAHESWTENRTHHRRGYNGQAHFGQRGMVRSFPPRVRSNVCHAWRRKHLSCGFWAHLPLTPVHIWAVLRRGLASFTGEATEESWLFPVEGIHVVGAGITQHHDRVIRSRRKPSIVVTHQGNTLQVDGLLQLKITQVEPFDGAISTGISEIQLLAIPGELQPTDVALVGFNPLLGLEVEQHELCRVSVDGRYIASIGRPARRVETLRARQRCELMGSKVEDANRGGGIARPC